MTNFEKYKDFFEKWAGREPIAIVNNKPKRCLDISCNSCDLKKDEPSCTTLLVKWLYEEYKEEPFLSKRGYHFLKSLPSDARIKISHDDKVIMESCGLIYKIFYRGNFFIPPLLFLEYEKWYEVSELLKWKVKEDN